MHLRCLSVKPTDGGDCFRPPSLSPFTGSVLSMLLFLSLSADLSFFPSFPPTLSTHWLLYILSSFCLTAAGLLWEVIRKNSTETQAPTPASKAFSTFSPSMHITTIGWQAEQAEGGTTGTWEYS